MKSRKTNYSAHLFCEGVNSALKGEGRKGKLCMDKRKRGRSGKREGRKW